jgi:phage-related protein
MVMWDADAAVELASLTSKEEKKALFNVIDKLRQLGERLVPPHMKPLKGGSGLRELRPRQGRTHVRAIYVRAGDQYVILSLCLKPDKADWEVALAAARDRSSLYTTVER